MGFFETDKSCRRQLSSEHHSSDRKPIDPRSDGNGGDTGTGCIVPCLPGSGCEWEGHVGRVVFLAGQYRSLYLRGRRRTWKHYSTSNGVDITEVSAMVSSVQEERSNNAAFVFEFELA